jgi:hypothetical protein
VEEYIKENMSDLAAEILDWKKTGLLHGGTGGKLRVLARMFEAEHDSFEHSSALRVAETMVCDEALWCICSKQYAVKDV